MHRTRTVLFALIPALLLFACTIAGRIGDGSVPVQKWDKRRGPVVPHENFPKDCSLCHEGGSWSKIKASFRFDHEKEAGLKLEGAHAKAECLRCHNDRGPVERFAQRGCAGCHEDVHQGHQGRECATCHNQGNWEVRSAIAEHNRTRFPLVGAHAGADCAACHEGAPVGRFDHTEVRCEGCHADLLPTALSPNHITQGWTSDCQRCHIPTTWTGAGFNHSTWPLKGVHRQIDCTQCHINNVFQGTPTQCIDCHQADYNATTNPNHATAGFGTACQSCHNANGWVPATFDHARFYPLTGAHASTSCAECHIGGVYRGTPTTCFGCHQDDYRGAIDPPHTTSGFPTTCQTCHNTSSWSRANFSHPDFPINSGTHSIFECSDCHTVPGVFTSFSCTSCHTHSLRNTNPDHDRVRNYVYNSNACYQCHPNGQKR